MEVRKIAVVGAGAMGAGIAQVAACSGYAVALQDLNAQLLDRGLTTIRNGMRRACDNGRMDPKSADDALRRILVTTALRDACDDAQFVIESVPESFELKKRVLQAIDQTAAPGAVIASNTGLMSITALAAVTGRPEQVVGMHWFIPPQIVRLVEIARGTATVDATVAMARAVAERMGKTTIVCRDVAGFVAYRALAAYVAECVRMLEEGVASAADIDTALKLGLGHPIGPLELCDLVGLDLIHDASELMVKAYGGRFRPAQSFVKLVEAGRLGRKTGRGFHRHD